MFGINHLEKLEFPCLTQTEYRRDYFCWRESIKRWKGESGERIVDGVNREEMYMHSFVCLYYLETSQDKKESDSYIYLSKIFPNRV